MSVEPADLEGFEGIVRLFPLPNLVLFPYMVQGLHIFEPRYRQMTADALASDRLIALALLAPGWEENYEGSPAIYDVTCLGKIVADQKLPDGRYNLSLRGLCRARVLREVQAPGKLYRMAEVELLPDRDPPAPARAGELRERLLELLTGWCAGQSAALDVLQKLLQSHLSLGAASDIVSYALPLPMEFKQFLLATPEIEPRVQALIAYLETHGPFAAPRKFPPDFSPN
jgi:Lon protease-like protein